MGNGLLELAGLEVSLADPCFKVRYGSRSLSQLVQEYQRILRLARLQEFICTRQPRVGRRCGRALSRNSANREQEREEDPSENHNARKSRFAPPRIECIAGESLLQNARPNPVRPDLATRNRTADQTASVA